MPNKFLSNQEIDSLVKAIKHAEENTTGEIRIHIDSETETNLAKKALDIFQELEIYNTKERNGVLFYIHFQQRYLTIIGDEGIHKKVCQNFWDQMHDKITNGFAKKIYFQSLCNAIKETGVELKKHFPSENKNNENELPNELSFS